MLDSKAVGLPEVLASREARVAKQQALLQSNQQLTLINFKCNIPGPVKNNAMIQDIFQMGLKAIMDVVTVVTQEILRDLKTGPEAYLLVSETPEQVKRLMVAQEESYPLARLYDSDVLYWEAGQVKAISRTDLGLPPRRCLICDEPAKACGRSRRHDVALLTKKILALYAVHRNVTHE